MQECSTASLGKRDRWRGREVPVALLGCVTNCHVEEVGGIEDDLKHLACAVGPVEMS